MKTLLTVIALAGAVTLAHTAVEQRVGSNVAVAQSSSACVQNCMNVRQWPEDQCRRYCKGKPKK
jgi:hypothetical protein